jgi:hypothetical protein
MRWAGSGPRSPWVSTVPFQNGNTVDREITATVGGRWFLSGKGSASYAVHLGAFRTEWKGAEDSPTAPATASSPVFTRPASPPRPGALWGPRPCATIRERSAARWSSWQAGTGADFWGGFALDSFSPQGRADIGLGFERACLDDPTNDLTACGWVGEVRGEWHFAHRSGLLGEFSSRGFPWSASRRGRSPVPPTPTTTTRPRSGRGCAGSRRAGLSPCISPRWGGSSWPADGFEDRTVGGLQLAITFD